MKLHSAKHSRAPIVKMHKIQYKYFIAIRIKVLIVDNTFLANTISSKIQITKSLAANTNSVQYAKITA